MDYIDIRNEFKRLSGRYDLEDNTVDTDMIDFFMNSAQRYLDRKLAAGKMEARFPIVLAPGDFIVRTEQIRSIKEVWATNSVGNRWELKRMTMNEFRWYFGKEYSLLTPGLPSKYAIGKFRPVPDNLIPSANMQDVEDVIVSNENYKYNGVIISPPTSEEITLTIWGLFYSPALSYSKLSKSYWTENHSDMLIQAAMMKVSSFYGDPTRAEEHKKSLIEDLIGLDFDLVDENLIDPMEMGL